MFKRCIDVSKFKVQMQANPFLSGIYTDLVVPGNAFLAFRDNEATFYYRGGQLCNIKDDKDFDPTINRAYLPLRTLMPEDSKYISEKVWLENTNLSRGYSSVRDEILENIRLRQRLESLQVSKLYRFSPLCGQCNSDIILLDIEAAFAKSSASDNDRIDAVLYHMSKRQLVFAEIKRLSDRRLQKGGTLQNEIVTQMNNYRNIIASEKSAIIKQYNSVIGYYSQLGKRKIPPIYDKKDILLGLWITEYTQDDEKIVAGLRQQIETSLPAEAKFPVAAIGQMSHTTPKTLEKVCDIFSTEY